MTIAEVNVNIQVALPQGWTAEQIRERFVDLLAETIAPTEGVVEVEVKDVQVNGDPFGRSLLTQLSQFPHAMRGGLRSNSW
jgi:hypothetical protein